MSAVSWWSDDLEDFGRIEVPAMEQVQVIEADNPVRAVLLDCDGDPLVVIRERSTVPFGFRP